VTAALLVQLLTRRQRERSKKVVEEAERIVDAVKYEDSAKRASSLEKLLDKLPSGLSGQEFLNKLERVALQLTTFTPVNPATSSAVENLINGYHEQALDQARAQFWFSIVAATVGFGWILFAGTDIKPDNLLTISKTLPGVVMDAVAFLFFRQASETRQRATELYDRLRRDKQTTESIALVSSIDDVRVRSAIKAQIALHMSGLQPNAIDLTNFF
jgi:hypothetical protein